MENTIEDLRGYLFDTIKALKDPDKPMELERAKAIANLAQVVINTAKVEVDYLRIQGNGKGTGFIPEKQIEQQPGTPRLVQGAAQSKSK